MNMHCELHFTPHSPTVIHLKHKGTWQESLRLETFLLFNYSNLYRLVSFACCCRIWVVGKHSSDISFLPTFYTLHRCPRQFCFFIYLCRFLQPLLWYWSVTTYFEKYTILFAYRIALHLVSSAYSIFRYSERDERIETTLMSVCHVQGRCHRLVNLTKHNCGRQRPTGKKVINVKWWAFKKQHCFPHVSSLCAKLSICWLNLDCERGISVHLQIFSKLPQNWDYLFYISASFTPVIHNKSLHYEQSEQRRWRYQPRQPCDSQMLILLQNIHSPSLAFLFTWLFLTLFMVHQKVWLRPEVD